MATLDFTHDALDFIKNLQAKQYKQVTGKIFELSRNATPADYSKLKGYDDLYRVDIGEFRIIYRFDKNTVFISLVGKRNGDEVYKQLKQKAK